MTIALYPGTFDPITNGHADLAERAAKLFGKVIVAIAKGSHKNTVIEHNKRINIATQVLAHLKNVEVCGFSTLLIDFAREKQASFILRGMRAVSDFEYEFQLASMNRRLAPQIETVFLTPAEQYAFISSSLVREIAALDGDVGQFVHPLVVKELRDLAK